MRIPRPILALLACLAALAAVTSCGKGTPVAPLGTVLSIAANPTVIGLTGSSVITVVGRRADGAALLAGTEIRLSTDRGNIPAVATTDATGTAIAVLQADGRAGVADVSATTGDGTTTAKVTVQVGSSPDSKPVLLVSANPSNVPVGGKSTITVFARSADGNPVGAGQVIVLLTSLGSLSPSRPVTKSDGTAISILSVGNQAGSAAVSAVLGTSDVQVATVTIRDAATDINLQSNPATITSAGGTLPLTAFVTDAQGQPLQGAAVTFQSDRGTLDTTTTFTSTSGVASNNLTLTQQDLNGVSSFKVTASTPNGTGQLLSDSVTIQVQ